MSDYLTNLVTRSREESLTVQPRLISLFEPVRGFILHSETEPVDEPSDSIVPAHREKVSTRNSEPVEPLAPTPVAIQSRLDQDSSANFHEASQPTDEKQTKSTMRGALERQNTAAIVSAEPAAPSSPAAETPALTMPKPQLASREIESSTPDKTSGRERSTKSTTDSPLTKAQVIATVVGHLALPPQPKEPTRPSLSVEPNFAKRRNQVRADEGTSPKAPSITNDKSSPPAAAPLVTRSQPEREPLDERHPSRRPEEPIRPSLVSHPTTKAAESTLPIIPRVTTSAPLTPESIRAESVEPVINVTIGRVEVRAPAPVTATPRLADSPKGSKLMSLDEYLHRRAQGGRR